MKMQYVPLLSIIAAFCLTQAAYAADLPKKKSDTEASKMVLGTKPEKLPDASALGRSKVDCKSDEASCGPIGVYAGYNDKLSKCVVYIDVGDINVPTSTLSGGRKIKVLWEIVSVDGGIYKFTGDGINIVSNDTTKDWDAKGHTTAAKTGYKWSSVHKRLWKSDYVVNVVRQHPTTGALDNCDPADPRINNT